MSYYNPPCLQYIPYYCIRVHLRVKLFIAQTDINCTICIDRNCVIILIIMPIYEYQFSAYFPREMIGTCSINLSLLLENKYTCEYVLYRPRQCYYCNIIELLLH